MSVCMTEIPSFSSFGPGLVFDALILLADDIQ